MRRGDEVGGRYEKEVEMRRRYEVGYKESRSGR